MGFFGKYVPSLEVICDLLHLNSHANLKAYRQEKLLFHGTNSHDLRANDWKDDGRYVLSGGEHPIVLFDNRLSALTPAIERNSPASLVLLAVNVESVRARLKEFFGGSTVGVDFLDYGEYLSQSFEFSSLDEILTFERSKIEKLVFDAMLQFEL